MTSAVPFPIAVFISGSGTNLQAILDATARGDISAEVRLVISSNPEAGGLERARRAGVPARVLRSKDFAGVQEFRSVLMEALKSSRARLVVLAGYMKKLPPDVIRAFPGRIINIHPALLPDFGGKGFYGRRVHEAVLESGRRESGATVHIVNDRYDEGPVLMQERVPVLEGDTPDSLAARVLTVEHRILPAAIQAFAQGRVRCEGERTWIEPA
jgi:phosphoribosylglycinamide formyltransferase-1